MNQRFRAIMTCAALAFAGHAAGGEKGGENEQGGAETARLQSYLDEIDALRARFESRLLDDTRQTVARSTGTVALKRTGRFRWEYDDPAPSLIVGDGRQVWSFDPELEQAVVREIDPNNRANPSLLLGGDARIGEEFEVTGSYTADGVEWTELAPRHAQADFVLVRLGFRDGVMALMELVDQLDQITQIEFSELERNPELEDSLFVFVPPEGVDVVGTPR